MTLNATRKPRFSPLAVFIGAVLLMDAIALGAVVQHIWSGHIATDWISFYTGGTLVRTGDALHLYDAAAQTAVQQDLAGGLPVRAVGYPLPVFAALVIAPLTSLSFAASYTIWVAISICLLAVLLRLSWRWLEDVPEALRVVFLAGAVSVPALNVLMQGQVDLFVLAGLVGCYALLRADKPFLGGSVLALALFKPHLAAAVVLLLLVKGQWRALGGLAAAGVPLMLVPPLVLGPRLLADQVGLLLSYTSSSTDYQVAADVMINIRGTVASLTGSSNTWLWLPLLALIAAVAIAVAVRVWSARPALHPQSWALAFVLPLLYSPHVHMQSLVLLMPAAGLYLVVSQSSVRPIVEVKYALYGLVAVTLLWSLSLSGVALMSFLIMGLFTLFSRRWPVPAAQAVLPIPLHPPVTERRLAIGA